MATFLEALGQVARQTYCFALGNFDNAAQAYGKYAIGPAAIARVSGAIRAQLCNGSPEPTELPPPPFEGGQCPEKYVVAYQFPDGAGGFNAATALTIGPIGGLDIEDGPSGSKRVFLLSNGTVVFGGLCFNVAFPATGNRTLLGTYTPIADETASITGLTACGADDCGDPPPVVPPPGDIIIEGDDITYEGDDSIEITVPTSFVFAPVYLAFDGSLRVPVNIDVGGVEFSGELTIAPEFNLEIKPSGPEPGPGEPDDPDEIGEPGEPSDPIPEEEELESTIVGVLVFSDIDPDGQPSSILFPSGPNLYVPRLASVQFAVKTGNSIGWTPDQDVKNLECYVPCPAPQGAIAVRVSPMPGVQSRFTAVRGKPLTSF